MGLEGILAIHTMQEKFNSKSNHIPGGLHPSSNQVLSNLPVVQLRGFSRVKNRLVLAFE
jgi:hypothetical protein